MRSVISALVSVGLVAVAWPMSGAQAQQCSANALATATMDTTSLASTPLSDAQYRDPADVDSYADSRSYLAKGNCLVAFYNEKTKTHQAGDSVPGFGPTERCFPRPIAGGSPMLVPLGATGELALIVAAGSWVYRLRAQDAAVQWSYNTARSGCAADTILASPAVLIKAYANNPSLYSDDLVYVSTCAASSCGGSWYDGSRVVALRANSATSTPTVAWNAQIGTGCGAGFALDYENDALWSTYQQPVALLPSLARLNATNGTAGTWILPAGDIRTPPRLRNGKVYVASYDATLRIYDQTTRALDMLTPLATGTQLTQPIWVENRNAGGYANLVLTTTTNGYMQATSIAAGMSGGIVPTRTWVRQLPGGIAAATTPSLLAPLGKIYVGGIDGKLYQLTASSGSPEASSTIGSATVNQPNFDFVGPLSSSFPNRVVVSAQTDTSTRMKSLCIPWALGAISTPRSGDAPSSTADTHDEWGSPCLVDADCEAPQWSNECTVAACIEGSCSAIALPNGTACKEICTGSGMCNAGTCNVTDLDSTVGCTCDAAMPTGGLGCSAGQRCCGAAGCKSLASDSNNCGACGVTCGSFSSGCFNGTCGMPWLVRVVANGVRTCAGAILSPNWIVTSASCLAGASVGNVRVITNNNTVFPAMSLVPHPLFDQSTFDYNIALVRVSGSITFSSMVQAITRATDPNLYLAGAPATNFGYTALGDAKLIITNMAAQSFWTGIISFTNNMMAASDVSGPCGISLGDPLIRVVSGTPYLLGIGMVSPPSCAYPGAWTRVDRFAAWIFSTAGI